MGSIPGYLDPLDALVFHAVLDEQRARGSRGDVCEIGTYYGRSYFLLRLIVGDLARVLSVDLYEDTESRDASPRYAAILARAGQMGLTVDPHLMMGADSTRLTRDDLLARAGPFRFFHIDGGHHYEHVAADAALARATLTDDGVIVFDDFCNSLWPEVTSGVDQFLRRNPEFAPVVIANMKLYVARRPHAARYKAALSNAPELRGMRKETVRYHSDEALRLSAGIARRGAHMVLERLNLQRFSAPLFS